MALARDAILGLTTIKHPKLDVVMVCFAKYLANITKRISKPKLEKSHFKICRKLMEVTQALIEKNKKKTSDFDYYGMPTY